MPDTSLIDRVATLELIALLRKTGKSGYEENYAIYHYAWFATLFF